MLRAGDWGVLAGGAAVVAGLAWQAWFAPNDAADTAVIRAGGAIVRTVALARTQTVAVAGPLGVTRIEIAAGRARVQADPSPRQLCVKQGWLARAGEAALCLPNQVSLELTGRRAAHDTLAY
jgi:hypothetical protein